MTLHIPALYEGSPAVIAWEGAAGPYRLERRLGASFDARQEAANWMERDAMGESWAVFDAAGRTWAQLDARKVRYTVYEGAQARYEDFIPKGARTVQYRLGAGEEELLSALTQVVQKEPAQIEGSDGDLGKKYRGFAVPYTINDPFPGAVLAVRVLLDGAAVAEKTGLKSPVTGQAAVADAQVAAMAVGSAHSLAVEVVDNLGLRARRVYTFEKMEDLRQSAHYLVLRDGKAIARLESIAPFIDYTAAGRHRYRVRAVDRFGGFADSNEVEVEISLPCTTLAPAAAPQRMVELWYRMDEPPQHTSAFQAVQRHSAFQGRRFACLEDTGERRDDLALRYSVDSREEYEAVLALADAGEPVVYRDECGGCALAAISRVHAAFHALWVELVIALTRLEGEAGVLDG